MSNGWKYLRMDSAIEKAKRRVENAYGCVQGSRKWLETLPLDSYEDESYRVKLFVLEGSPCKGYVLADYGRMIVKPISLAKHLREINARDEEV